MTAAAPSPIAPPVPAHVAKKIDGNCRLAKQRIRPRTFGHYQGVEPHRKTVEAAGELGIRYLTIFGFSTENWRRPPDEVNALLELMRIYVGRDLDKLVREGVRVRVIGERVGLDRDLVDIITRAEAKSAHNDKLHLTIAFNYGGQDEIARAAKRLAADVAAGVLAPADVNTSTFGRYLDTVDLPELDLLIRVSGEVRLSNFLLWQTAYAELVFLDVLWPDFDKSALQTAIDEFRRRDRRFGASEPTA